ncbi:MAG: hypothetical protein JO146_04680, partial [Candidatus Eremiobacteraeota bacterium]|nr:hypothetical protein [Candidatus Eremiobacteraeota bacterium]
MTMLKRIGSIALLATLALAGCNGGTTPTPVPTASLPPGGGLTQQNFVGIGDSLMAGEQSDGVLGTLTANPISALPGNAVTPTQTNSFYALMYAQMNGIALDPAKYNLDTKLGDPANSPLPLIAAPGLGAQIKPSAVSPPFAATHSGCDGFNQQAYSQALWPLTRLSASAPIANLGVPGMTMHEAATMTAPLTGPPNPPSCGFVTIPGDPTSGGLQELVNSESNFFYPVLGQFQSTLGAGRVTALSAAVSLKPQLTIVILGGNDILKFIGSNGQSPITDTPQQYAADLKNIITTLEKAGSKVVVGNLPDILGNPATNEAPIPQYFPQTKLAADMQALGVPAAAAAQVAAYVSATYTKGNGGFLTESGFFGLVSQLQSNPAALPNLDPTGPGSGAGSLYVPQALAAQAIG